MIKKIMIAMALASTSISANAADLTDVNRIQHQVNTTIKYKKEIGTNDYWQIPTKSGDCEDIALLKRELLIDAGWAAEDIKLLLLVNTDELHSKRISDGHVVLYIESQNMILDMPLINTFKKANSSPAPQKYESYLKDQNYSLFCVLEDISLGHKYDAISKRCAKVRFALK